MSKRDSEVRVRRSRIRDRGRGFSRPKNFVGQVMRAAKKAGHVGHSFGCGKACASLFRFGRAGVLRSRCRCDRPHDVWYL
jgi:hypothetical protein